MEDFVNQPAFKWIKGIAIFTLILQAFCMLGGGNPFHVIAWSIWLAILMIIEKKYKS